MIAQRCPTNEQIRQQALENVPPIGIQKGGKADFIHDIVEEFNRLQFQYYPLFCEEARIVNLKMLKELTDYGNKTPTKMIGGKVYEGTVGWSNDCHFQHKWIVPTQLKCFMEHIDKSFWADEKSKVRDKFMKGILKGEDSYILLDGVYKFYGQNVIKPCTKEDREALGISN